MKKRWMLSATLALFLSAASVSAEQPAAEQYRQMFHSGNFYVEFKDNYTTRIIGEKNGIRMERSKYESKMGWMTFLNPLGALFGGGSPKYPEVMHQDGKYYQFTAKDKATVCEESQLEDENLNPQEGWNGIGQKLAIPQELAVFYWEDPYRESSFVMEPPVPTWSGKKTVDKKEYDCDRYASRIKSAASGGETYYVYEMLYENGALKLAQSYILSGGKEHLINTLSIKKMEGEMPQDLFKISEKTKVYAAGTGDMNDLLEQPVEVGQMEGI